MAVPLPLRKPRFLEGVRASIVVAVLLALAIDLGLAPPASVVELVARALAFALLAGFQILLALWLGRRTWPVRGRRIARGIVKRTFRENVKPVVFVTDRPDSTAHLGRRIWEVVGFAAGGSVVVAATLPVLGFTRVNVYALATLLALVALWGSFVLVPYWLFARMGLRRVDPVRWTVEPVSRRYAGRLRLSNGALLVFALGASVNLAFRAGYSGEAALVDAIRGVVGVVLSVFLIAACAAAFYTEAETRLVKAFEEEVLNYGIRDARGMTDGDFLPRLRT